MSEEHPETVTIITILVNALMAIRSDGATDDQILEAALSTWVSLVLTLRQEEYTISALPQIQEAIYHKWQERLANEGVGMARH